MSMRNPLHYQLSEYDCGPISMLNGFGEIRNLPVSSRYLSGKSVYLGRDSYLNDALLRGGVAVVRLYYDEPHYVLLIGVGEDGIRMFDPYYREKEFEQEDILLVKDEPFRYNRIVPETYFNQESEAIYALGPYSGREAVLLFNEDTKVIPEKSIEYFI